MRINHKGQVTIPKHLRDEMRIGSGSELDLERVGETIVLRRVGGTAGRGARLAQLAVGQGDVAMTTDEIMALTRDLP